MNKERMEELQRKYRPELFRTSVCDKCGEGSGFLPLVGQSIQEDLIDPLTHVCNPERLAAYQKEEEYWLDPNKNYREQVTAELRGKLETVLTKYGAIVLPEALDEMMTTIEPYYSAISIAPIA